MGDLDVRFTRLLLGTILDCLAPVNVEIGQLRRFLPSDEKKMQTVSAQIRTDISKPFLILFQKYFFEKVDFERNSQTTHKSIKIP